jgi:hypothetical protein
LALVAAPFFIQLEGVVRAEQSSILLCFRHMHRHAASLTITTITPGMRAVPGPVASTVVVEAEVVAICPALAVHTSSSTAIAVAARLVLLATVGTPMTILGWPDTFLLLLVEGPPLLGGV